MAWECSDCGREEERGSKITVCHHCGRPVCNLHRVMVPDDAFNSSPGQIVTNFAIHCPGCWSAFHPQAANVESGAPGAGGWTTA